VDPELAAAAGRSFEIPLSGRLFGDVYVPLQRDGSGEQISTTSAWLAVDPRWGDGVGARVVGSGDVFISTAGAERLRPRLREGYLYLRRPGLEVRAGQQIIPWGQADAVNPTDFLTAKDYTFFNHDEEVRRVGSPSLSLSWTPHEGGAPLTLTAVVVAWAAESTVLLPAGLIPPSASWNNSPEAAVWSLARTEAALKAAYAGQGWDASVVGFRGWSHLPELGYAGYDAARAQVIIRPVFHRITAVGGDGSIALGPWVVRGEGAYVFTENNDGTNPLIQPSHWDMVAGVERPLAAFRVGVQGVWRWNTPQLSPPEAAPYTDPYSQMANPMLARANSITFRYQEKHQGGATLRIAYTNEDRGIDVDLFGYLNFLERDAFVRIRASYLVVDALRVTLGLDSYSGPADSPFGAFKDFSSAFLEIKYSF
jgi:hypothetical protein